MRALFFLVPGLVALAGLIQVLSPAAAWRARRRFSRSAGLAVADAPEAGDLRVVRIQGAFFVVVAAAVVAFGWPLIMAD